MTSCHPKRKARRKNWKQWDKRTSQIAHAAKERKRMADAVAAKEVGVIVFTGQMFGGVTHRIRCLHRDGDRVLLLEIDGRPVRPRSYRGVLRLLAKRLTN